LPVRQWWLLIASFAAASFLPTSLGTVQGCRAIVKDCVKLVAAL
jgi:hypothetical protein